MGAAAFTGQPEYLSYLLRLWRAGEGKTRCDEEHAIWRASLESSTTGERIGFASLDELFEFLQQQMGVASHADKDNAEARGGNGQV